MKCQECEDEPAHVRCEECGQNLCRSCEDTLHKKGKRKEHTRVPACLISPGREEPEICPDSTFSQPRDVSVVVYWDQGGLYPKTIEEVEGVMAKIRQDYPTVSEIRAYAQNFIRLSKEMKALGLILVRRDGLSDYESIIMDISLKTRSEKPDVLLLLSSSAAKFRSFLTELIDSAANLQVMVSCTTVPVAFRALERAAKKGEETHLLKPGGSQDRKGPNIVDFVSILQICPQKSLSSLEAKLVDYLKSCANQGKVMLELTVLLSSFQHYAVISNEEACSAVNQCKASGILHVTSRSFGTLKTLTFVSAKASHMSLELLLWALRSLKNDEMLPCERAIQSRMKEAFDFKPTPGQWQQLLEVVGDRNRHSHSNSAPEMHYSKGKILVIDSPLSIIPNFIITDVTDPTTGLDSKVVHPEGENWVALDTFIKTNDTLRIKDTPEWQVFLNFLEGYFTAEDKQKTWRRLEEDKAIVGGRYGCAQFLKYCGPETLRVFSLGKLSYMVQLAINEDLLRYQKTLLTWVQSSIKTQDVTSGKVKIVQKAVTDVLKEAKGEVSLAQLPLLLRRQLNFPLELPELGFAKLKDLLASIPDVRVQLKASNHPFAVLQHHSSRSASPITEFPTKPALEADPWNTLTPHSYSHSASVAYLPPPTSQDVDQELPTPPQRGDDELDQQQRKFLEALIEDEDSLGRPRTDDDLHSQENKLSEPQVLVGSQTSAQAEDCAFWR